MPDFIVDESQFMLNMEQNSDNYLQNGQILANGIIVSELVDYSNYWQLYISQDGNNHILAVNPKLAKQWLEQKYLPARAFFKIEHNGEDLYLLLSPSSLILQSVNQIKFYGSKRYALSFAAAMFNSRLIDHNINLRDGIYCELFSVILPSYSQTRAVADRAIFINAIGHNIEENIQSPQEMQNPGLSYYSVKQELKNANINLDNIEPYLQNGEPVDDFIKSNEQLHICGVVALHEKYQIYHVNSDIQILVMENSFANDLIDAQLIRQMDLATIQVGFKTLKVLSFRKYQALDILNDRHFGLTKDGALNFAQAVRRTRAYLPYASFKDAIYVQEYGLLFPVDFSNNELDDELFVKEIVKEGPFASCAFLEDHIFDAERLAK